MMDDLISRQNLIMTLTVTAEETKQMKVEDMKNVINVINNLPSAQKKGHWIERHYLGRRSVTVQVCNQCRTEWSYDAETGVSDYFYCPHCGADMRGEENG